MCEKETTIRLGSYSIDQVLPFIRYGVSTLPVHKTYADQEVRMNTATLKTFAIKGITCIKCGLVGSFFALEKTPNNKQDNKFHFNLYGLDIFGNEILIILSTKLCSFNKTTDKVPSISTSVSGVLDKILSSIL